LARTVDFAAREPHHLDHLAAIWNALPEEARGTFYLTEHVLGRARTLGVEKLAFGADTVLPSGGPVLVVAYGDLRRVGNRSVIFGEHGAGQSYSNHHSSYAGGSNRTRVRLFLCPNKQAADRNRQRYPRTAAKVVGMPVMDRLLQLPTPPPDPLVVAISFHWRCRVVPEADSTIDYYKLHLKAAKKELEASGVSLIGHSHPRIATEARHAFEKADVEYVGDFEEVVSRAHLYAVDNSSTLYQFAALGRPVVVLNSPKYRPWVHHGLRFWDEANVGLNVDDPRDLARMILLGLEDDPIVAKERRASVERVVPHLGESAALAAKAILGALG